MKDKPEKVEPQDQGRQGMGVMFCLKHALGKLIIKDSM